MKSAHSPTSLHSSSRTTTRVLACLLILCANPIVSAAQNTDSSQQTIEHIHGVVLDAIDKKPVARALVTSQDQRMATMTDSDGRFAFDVRRVTGSPPSDNLFLLHQQSVARQTIYLMARRPGYIAMNLPVRLSADPQTTSQEIELKIVPEGMIRGHLYFSGDAKPTGVQVQLRRRQVQDGRALWVQTGGVLANSHGDYRFADLPAGDYKVMTQAWTERGPSGPLAPDETSGYAPAYYADTADLASSPPLHLAAGQTAEANLNLRPSTLYHVTVPVPSIAKGVGYNVTVGNEDESPGYFMNFNSQTQMAEGFLPNGTYDIRISSYGQQPNSGMGRVEVAGRPVKALPISLVPFGQISVIVHQQYTATHTDDPPAPSTGNRGQMGQRRSLDVVLRPVGLQGPWANLRNSPPDKNDDDLVLENVQPGAYRVVATPFRGYVTSISSDGVDLLRQPLVVGPGGTTAPIEVTLRDDTATLSGSVLWPNTTPSDPDGDQSLATLLCIPTRASSANPYSGIVTNRGKFNISNLAPGEYLVLAQKLAPDAQLLNIEYQNPDVLREYQSKGTTVTLTPGQKADIQVPLLLDEAN
jgi:hypothetical protein